MRIVR